MTGTDHVNRASLLVFDYIDAHLNDTDSDLNFTHDDLFVVWFGYILGGWKALVGTTLPDSRYYEITHNANNGETYLDVYEKIENVVIPPQEDSE